MYGSYRGCVAGLIVYPVRVLHEDMFEGSTYPGHCRTGLIALFGRTSLERLGPPGAMMAGEEVTESRSTVMVSVTLI